MRPKSAAFSPSQRRDSCGTLAHGLFRRHLADLYNSARRFIWSAIGPILKTPESHDYYGESLCPEKILGSPTSIRTTNRTVPFKICNLLKTRCAKWVICEESYPICTRFVHVKHYWYLLFATKNSAIGAYVVLQKAWPSSFITWSALRCFISGFNQGLASVARKGVGQRTRVNASLFDGDQTSLPMRAFLLHHALFDKPDHKAPSAPVDHLSRPGRCWYGCMGGRCSILYEALMIVV